jgi:hypothetical protein
MIINSISCHALPAPQLASFAAASAKRGVVVLPQLTRGRRQLVTTLVRLMSNSVFISCLPPEL